MYTDKAAAQELEGLFSAIIFHSLNSLGPSDARHDMLSKFLLSQYRRECNVFGVILWRKKFTLIILIGIR
jgi:hypothetical protein